MARLAYVAPDGDVTDRIRARRGGKLTALDGVLLHSPPFAANRQDISSLVRVAGERDNSYSHADREFVDQVLAVELGTNVVQRLHVPDAIAVGVRIEAIDALRAGDDDALTDDERLLATYIRQVVGGTVDDETWDAMELRLGTRGLVEYTTDFYVLRPRDPAKGTGRILYEVNNRGRKMLFGNIADGPQGINDPQTTADVGNGFPMRRGWTIVSQCYVSFESSFVTEQFVFVGFVWANGDVDWRVEIHPGDVALVVVVGAESVGSFVKEVFQRRVRGQRRADLLPVVAR